MRLTINGLQRSEFKDHRFVIYGRTERFNISAAGCSIEEAALASLPLPAVRTDAHTGIYRIAAQFADDELFRIAHRPIVRGIVLIFICH